ncbi:MAG: BamA/TamA family outer membrane protein [Saprospiraceae bacterium]
MMTGIPLKGQVPKDSLASSRAGFLQKSSLIVLPIVFYTPETRFGGGGAALYTFRFVNESATSRPSQLQLGLAYTQEKQMLFYLPFEIYAKKENWLIAGELGFYRYVYRFFGIGNETPSESETYEATYPRVQFNIQKMIFPRLYVGLRYGMDDYRIAKKAADGQLLQSTISGQDGGVIAGLGWTANHDTRNHLFYPTHGHRVQLVSFFNRRALGSHFNFDRYSLDVSQYFSLGKGIIALNAVTEMLSGAVPFQQLALIGGPKKMRGFFEGRFRDKNLWILQAEYRRGIKGMFGLALFTGIGNVAPKPGLLFNQQIHFSYGLGLRIRLSKKDKINLRIDFGANEEGTISPYLTVAEAF